jgi:N6-adenosine-specific RNA methylase IME4
MSHKVGEMPVAIKSNWTLDKAARRAERERVLGAKQRAMPTRKYGVIYCDPPWRFEPYSRETGMDRAADNHYSTMATSEIMAMAPQIEGIAAKDCVLFLWATGAMCDQAFDLMRAWSFKYKSQYVWIKDRSATGYWNRNRHELLLIGTKGNIPCPAMGTQPESTIFAAKGRHSAKPAEVRDMIMEQFPSLPRIELFARERVPGWDCWGDEVPSEEGKAD